MKALNARLPISRGVCESSLIIRPQRLSGAQDCLKAIAAGLQMLRWRLEKRARATWS
jgi:hypothetical protein